MILARVLSSRDVPIRGGDDQARFDKEVDPISGGKANFFVDGRQVHLVLKMQSSGGEFIG